jgi:DNA repair exonuclease SbcCD nuclease subunit
MVRFAHLADVHLGAFREPRLREANLEAFIKALDMCRAEHVDFILVCGDLFHTSLPDMGIVERATAKLRETVDAGIPVYVIYGSHDFSAAERSIVDVLSSAGVFEKVTRASVNDEGAIVLERTSDERTGTVLAGLSGRKLGLDKSYYENLDASEVVNSPGPKVFCFHGAITEMKPRELAEMAESMPASLLPRGFDYYAGGHVHDRMTSEIPGWGLIAYPGPLFGDGYKDLESKEPRGFYIVTLESGRPPELDFRALPARKTRLIEIDADGRSPEDVNRELKKKAEEAKADDAIVLVKVKGELSTGKASEVDTGEAQRLLSQEGAFSVYVNRGGLSTKERAQIRVEGEDGRAETETKLLRENLAEHPSRLAGLKGEEGLLRARRLLRVLGEEPKAGTRADQEAAVIRMTEEVLFGERPVESLSSSRNDGSAVPQPPASSRDDSTASTTNAVQSMREEGGGEKVLTTVQMAREEGGGKKRKRKPNENPDVAPSRARQSRLE